MKTLLITLLTLVSLQCLAQRDTTIRHIYSKDTLLHMPDLSFTMWKEIDLVIKYVFPDTAAILRLKCNVTPPPPPVTGKLDRVLYIGSTEFLAALNGGAPAQEMKWYLQDYGFNGVSYYGLGSTSSSDWPKIRALNKDLRMSYGIKIIEATGSSLSSLQTRIAFNTSCTDPREKFDIYNNEDEYWNADPNGDGVHSDAEILSAWKTDSASMIPMRAAADQAGIGNEWYHGWPIKFVLPLHMLRKLTKIMYHVYNPGAPNVNYGDWRWKDAETGAQQLGLSPGCIALLSSEGAFSGPWLATNSLDTVDELFIQKFKQYPHLKLERIQWFMYSKLKAYKKPKRLVPVTAFFKAAPAVPDTSTSKNHLDMARER